MINYQVRKYQSSDAEKIGIFDKVAELAYLYKGDFKPENIFCAVGTNDEILGVADLEPHISWTPIDKDTQSADYIYRLVVNMRMNPKHGENKEVKNALMDKILNRAREIKSEYPGKKLQVIRYIPADNREEMDFYLSQDFVIYRTSIVMKRDLAEEIKEYPCTSGISVTKWKMESEAEVKMHVEADERSNNGAAWNIDTMRWIRYAPEWIAFSAFEGEKLVGSVMTFAADEGESCTENIFVLPEYRGRGISKVFITEALKYLKDMGKMRATLCTDGDNKTAISLYKSLGYKIASVNLEFGYNF